MKSTTKTFDKEVLRQAIEDMLVSHTAFSQAKITLEQGFNAASTLRDSVGYFLSGVSRTGKTRLMEEFEAEHPSFRVDGGKIVPVLRVEVPSKPTVRGLASEILAALGDPCAEKGTEQDKTRRLIVLLKKCETKVLIIDEIQHFVDKTAKFRIIHHLTDWLKTLLNKTNIIIVIAGLPYAQALLSQNEQLRGRFIRSMTLPRFDWQDDTLRAEFLGLMGGFAELLRRNFSLPDIEDEDVAYRFYLASGGLTGYVFNILRQAAWNVIDDERAVITLEDIDVAYQNVVSKDDQYSTSPFSRKFDLNDGQSLIKASQIGTRADEYGLDKKIQMYKPNSTREALAW
jgi:predicted AAA+ superfamily ATPase